MTRFSHNVIDPTTGYLCDGYDYINQAWVVDGHYIPCGHSVSMACSCYGRLHQGEPCTNSGELEGVDNA